MPTAINVEPDIQRLEGLSPLPSNLEELADALEGDPLTTGGLLDVDVSAVWSRSLIDSDRKSEGPDRDENIEHWLRIDGLGSHAI